MSFFSGSNKINNNDQGPSSSAVNCIILITRFIYCVPTDNNNKTRKIDGGGGNANDGDGDNKNFDNNSTYTQALRWVSFLFAIYGLIKFVFDFITVIRLYSNNNNTHNNGTADDVDDEEEGEGGGNNDNNESTVVEGTILLIGMIFAYAVHSLGERRIVQDGGCYWAPFFFTRPDRYYRSFPVESRRRLRLLFAIAFTEVAAFFFEDGAYIAIFGKPASRAVIDEFDRFNTLDLINLWLTFVRTVLTGIILCATLAATLNCGWCRKAFLAGDKDDDTWSAWFMTNIWGRKNIDDEVDVTVVRTVWNSVKIILFLALWTGILAFLGVNLFLIYCLIVVSQEENDNNNNNTGDDDVLAPSFSVYRTDFDDDESPGGDDVSTTTVDAQSSTTRLPRLSYEFHERYNSSWIPLVVAWTLGLYFVLMLNKRGTRASQEQSRNGNGDVFGTWWA